MQGESDEGTVKQEREGLMEGAIQEKTHKGKEQSAAK